MGYEDRLQAWGKGQQVTWLLPEEQPFAPWCPGHIPSPKSDLDFFL